MFNQQHFNQSQADNTLAKIKQQYLNQNWVYNNSVVIK